jgi:predicted RNase H-like HicB family nuclease
MDSVTEYHFRVWGDEGGYYGAQCLEIPQAISHGKSFQECIKNSYDALELALEYKNEFS